MEKCIEFNIDLNAKCRGRTAFHWVCMNNQSKIVELLIQNSNKIDLTAKNRCGQTGFQVAVSFGKTETVNLIKEKMPRIAY